MENALEFKHESIYELNDLAAAIKKLTEADQKKLGAAVILAEPEYASQIRHLAENLDQFEFAPDVKMPKEYGQYMIQESGYFDYDESLDEFYDYEKYGQQRMSREAGMFTETGYISYWIIPKGTCDREFGGYVVEHGLVMDFPEEVRPYLDYVGIGAEYYADHGGAYTMDGYVMRRDGQPEQTPEHTVFSAYLRSHCGAKRLRFYFPTAEEALEKAKQRLQIDSFAEAEVEALDCDIPYLVDLLPASCISMEDINELALAVEEMKQTDGETLKYLSVLSVEQPEDFPAALRLAINLDDYERVPEDASEYGEEILHRLGADDEVLDAIDGYMDFAVFGEAQMQEDGVRTYSSMQQSFSGTGTWPRDGLKFPGLLS